MVTRHHILSPRREWTLRPEARKLRDTPSLIPTLGSWAIHQTIHTNCPPVPLLSYHALCQINNEFTPTENTIKSMENLMFAIEKSSKHYKTHPIERELAELTIEAIDLQRPYIKEGLS